MTKLLPAFALIAFLAAPVAAHAQLSGYAGGGYGGGGHGGGGYGGGGHGGGGHGGGGHGGGGHGGGDRGNVNIGINISNHASAYAASSAYAAASARGSAYAAQSGFYGGSQSESVAYGSAFAMGGGYGYGGGGCANSCLGGHVYAPYGPGGPYVTYTVIDSRSYRREEASYGYSDSSGYAYEGGHGYACRSDSRRASGEDCDSYSHDSRERGDYVRAYDQGYRAGYTDSYYSRDCDCQVDRTPPLYEAPPPTYQPEADPYYFPSEPQVSCYQARSGECG